MSEAVEEAMQAVRNDDRSYINQADTQH